MRRSLGALASALMLTQIALVPTAPSVEAAPSPPTPDCSPDPVTAPGTGTGPNSITGVVGITGVDTLEDVQVTASNVNTLEYSETQTDANGVYLFDSLTDGNYHVYLTEPGYGPLYYCQQSEEMAATTVSVSSGTHLGDVDLLVAAGTIGGSITADGQPVPAGQIWLRNDMEMDVRSTSFTNGVIDLKGVADGTYRLAVEPYDSAEYWYGGTDSMSATPIVIDGTTPNQTINLALPSGGFNGVLSSGGIGLAFERLEFHRVGSSLTGTAYTDDFGNFTVSYLPAGDYTAVGQLGGDRFGLPGTFSTDGISITTGLALEAPTGSISGAVTRDMIPVDGMMEAYGVYIVSSDFLYTSNETYVDIFGNYAINTVADGNYYVLVSDYVTPTWWYPGVADQIDAQLVTVSGGSAETASIDIPGTPPGVTISGQVRDQNLLGVANVVIEAWQQEWWSVSSATTDGAGNYTLTVPDGADYRVSARPGGAPSAVWYDGAADYWSAAPINIAGSSASNIDFSVARSGFSGTLDDGTNPVPWVGIQAIDVTTDPTMGSSAWTTTDEFGGFAFEFLPAGTYRVLAADPTSGGQVEVGTAVSDGATVATGITFSLPSGSVSGAITIGGVAPDVAGYSVHVSLDPVNRDPGRYANANPDGTYSFATLPDGDYYARAYLQIAGAYPITYPNSIGDGDATVVTVSGGGQVGGIDIDLPTPGVIRGTVRGSDGLGLSTGVTIERGPNCTAGGYVSGTTSDASGYYEFTVMPFDYCVVAQHDGSEFGAPGVFERAGYQVNTVAAGQTIDVDIDLPAPATISGQVTDGTTGVGGVSVVVPDFYPGSDGRVVAVTEPDGTYTTQPMYDTSVRLGFRPQEPTTLAPTFYPGAPSFSGAAVLDLTGGSLIGIDAVLAEYGSVSGTITAPDGNITRAVVRAWDAASEFTNQGFDNAVAILETLDGTYSFDQLPPGDYVISTSPYYDEPVQWATTYYAISGPVIEWDMAGVVTVSPASSTTIDIRAEFGLWIDGKVVDGAGNPLPGIIVNASTVGGGDPRYEWRETVTATDGTYKITGLAPGEFRVFAGPRGQVPWILGEYYVDQRFDPDATAGVTVAASGPSPVIDFELETGIPAYITLVDDNGPVPPPTPGPGFYWVHPALCIDPAQPDPGNQVDYCGTGWGLGIGTSISAGSTGYFIGGLHDATYNIAMNVDGALGDTTSFAPTFGDRVDCVLAMPGSSQTSTCTVQPDTGGATISGTVIDAYGDPEPGVVVNVYDSRDGVLPIGGYTAADGTYTIANVPPGTYQLQFEAPYRRGGGDVSLNEWYSAGGQAYYDDYDLADDIVMTGAETITGIDVQLDLPNSGTVVVGDGTPIGDLFVVACPAPSVYNGGFSCDGGTGSWSFAEIAGNTGTFSYLLPGDYTIVGAQRTGWFDVSVITDPATVSLPVNHTFECTLPLLGDGTPSCTVTPISFVDDNDGVDPVEEQGAPNGGDGDGDGIADNQQNSVASLADPSIGDPGGNGSNYVTIVASTADGTGGTQPKPLANVSLVQPTVAPPPGVTPQSSLVAFEVDELDVGETVNLRFLLPQAANSYWKFDAVTGTWTDYTSLATFDPESSMIGDVERWGVTLSIVDGGFGDNDLTANGRVVDPGVFANTETDAPVVELIGITPGQTFTVSETIAAECLTTDAESGIGSAATLTITPIGDPHDDGVGWFTATCDGAVDLVGNESEPVSTTFRVRYDRADGVFTGGSAVASPAVNVGKAGRTYPLRWELYRADGSRVTDLDAVTGWQTFEVSCTYIDGEEDPLPEGTIGYASTLSVTSDGVFKLNLKTDKSPGCRILIIGLVDGTSISARLDLR